MNEWADCLGLEGKLIFILQVAELLKGRTVKIVRAAATADAVPLIWPIWWTKAEEEAATTTQRTAKSHFSFPSRSNSSANSSLYKSNSPMWAALAHWKVTQSSESKSAKQNKFDCRHHWSWKLADRKGREEKGPVSTQLAGVVIELTEKKKMKKKKKTSGRFKVSSKQ